MPSYSPTTERRVLHGNGRIAFAVAATFALVAILLGLWYPAAGMLFAFFAIAGIILFISLGFERHLTTIQIADDHLLLTSWFAQRTIPLAAIDSVSVRMTLIGRSLAHAIVFWTGSGEELLVVDMSLFPKQQLLAMLKTIQVAHPRLQIDCELQQLLTPVW